MKNAPPLPQTLGDPSISMLKIDPEFKALLPPLSDEETRLLHESLLADGCLAPVVTWKGKDIVLDGYNRVPFCDANEIEYYQAEVELPDRDAAMAWILRHTLARRNLSPKQTRYLRGKQLELEKQSRGGDRKSNRQSDGLTAERLAEEHGVSPRTIERDAEFASDVDDLPEERRQEVLSGRERASKAEVREEVAARRKIQEQGSPTAKAALDENTIALPKLDMLVELDWSEQDEILAGGPEKVDAWVRQQTQKAAQQGKPGKGAQTPSSASRAEAPAKNWEEAIEALKLATSVLRAEIAKPLTMPDSGYAQLQIQTIVGLLNDLWTELERKDQD